MTTRTKRVIGEKSAKTARVAISSASSEISEQDNTSEMDPIEYDVTYGIQSIQNSHLGNLHKFLSDPKLINQKGDPTTNIIDRQNGKCYNIPDKKIDKFFTLLEECRKASVYTMMAERQGERSGIVLDFDIYQDTPTQQVNDDILHYLCKKIIDTIIKIIDFKDTKKTSIYIGITRKPSITENEEKQCYKDGFHILIPSVKVSRGVKKLLINKLIRGEHLDQLMADVQPANIKIGANTGMNSAGLEQYERKHFLDTHSAVVPVFFVGSCSKKGSPPYKMTHIYEAKINLDHKDIILERCAIKTNLCYEFSLNYEAPNSIVKKIAYEVLEKFRLEVEEYETPNKEEYDTIKNFGALSMNSIHDAQIQEIKDLLDTLAPSRASDYKQWLDVLYALAATSSSYKHLAEYFSRKSSKFRAADFEKFWEQALKGPPSGRKAITLASLHYWAQEDNKERYDELRKKTVYSVLYQMVYEGYKEGLLSHADIANLLHRLLKHKYKTDIPEGERLRVWYEFILDEDDQIPGELYKWRKWKSLPVSLSQYISMTLPNLFEQVFKTVKQNYERATDDLAKYYNKVLQNFKATMRKLGDRSFKHNVIMEAEERFNSIGFAESLDKDPNVRGVANGILKLNLGARPALIQGYHNYNVSKFTDVPYIPFNPYDPLTKDIIMTLRKVFPDNEPDTFEFMMSYFASTIDGNPKESMFLMLVGRGSNGKTFLVELHKSVIGATYGVKMPLCYLTAKSGSADTATPAQMLLKDASLAYYSESNKHEILNVARIKEVTGLETIAGRKLHQDMINFKPRCHHLVTTNYDFDVECNDHGTWRRLLYIMLKITFVDPTSSRYDPSDPYQRIANSKVTEEWTESNEVRGRYLGFMVWFHYWLYKKYAGKVMRVPHPHIEFETAKYRRRQDTISAFLAQRCVKCADDTLEYNLADECQKYIKWYENTHNIKIAAKGIPEQFQNSEIGKYIKPTARGPFLIGYRFLDKEEKLADGENYAIKGVFELEPPEDNFGLATETPEEYYDRLCREYDQNKHLFNDSIVPAANILDICEREDNLVDASKTKVNKMEYDVNGMVLPSGVVIKPLEEPKRIMEQLNDIDDLADYASPAELKKLRGDSDEEESDSDEEESKSETADQEDAVNVESEAEAVEEDEESESNDDSDQETVEEDEESEANVDSDQEDAVNAESEAETVEEDEESESD